MIGKKGKIILIILIFIMVFEFSYPIVYAGDGMIDITKNEKEQQKENEASGNTSNGSSNSSLGTIVDHGLRFTY